MTKTIKVKKEIGGVSWTLQYNQLTDEWGMTVDNYVLIDNKKRIHYPFYVDIRAKMYTPSTNILDNTNEPTKKEMRKKLIKFVDSITLDKELNNQYIMKTKEEYINEIKDLENELKESKKEIEFYKENLSEIKYYSEQSF